MKTHGPPNPIPPAPPRPKAATADRELRNVSDRAPLSVGADEIAKERRRQIQDEGWTDQHDDQHFRGSMLLAATAYIRAALNCIDGISYRNAIPPEGWPWQREWWKPSRDPQRNIIKAGALIAAEIDRLHRKQVKAPADNNRI